MRKVYALCFAVSMAIAPIIDALPASAAVSEQEAKRLDGELTPMGAERAGNASGAIPAWEGGLSAVPAGVSYKPGDHLPDPFASDQPLYTITRANMAEYDALLTDGHKGLLAAYPDTYLMHVYQTRRSCAYPPQVYEAVRRNAVSGQLTENGNSITGATMASPFPIPQSVREVLWNHELRYQGFKVRRESASATPTKGGDFTIEVSHDEWFYNWSDPSLASTEALDNVIFRFLKQGVSPSSSAGSVMVMHNTLNQVAEMRRVWNYRPGERKVKRQMGTGYDSVVPASEGIRTGDNMQVFNGAADRYDWELVGKQEKIIPYNTSRLASPELKYEDILHKKHLNPEPIRYELHRVWVLEAKLKPGQSHIIAARRKMYLDEDSWTVLATALSGKDDKLARVQEAHLLNMYDHPLCAIGSDVVYDVTDGRYHVMGLRNQQKAVQYNAALDPENFSPEAMRRLGMR